MRFATMLSTSVGLLIPVLLHAQASPQLVAGDTIRFRTVPEGPWEIHVLQALADSMLVVDAESGTVLVPLSSVGQLEVRRQRHFDRRNALIGAGAGAAIGTMLPLALGATAQDAGGIVVSAAVLGLAGGALGGGGSRALRSGRTGLIVGSGAGALIGVALVEPCSPGSWMCYGPVDYVLMGAIVGGIAGGVVGTWVGAVTPKRVWEPIPPARLSLAPTRDGGMTFSVTLGR